MKKKEITIYEFKELSPKIQEKVIDKFRQNIWNEFESEMLTKDFKEILVSKGFDNLEIYWSLGYSQGDGVAFYGKPDFDVLCTKYEELQTIKKKIEEIGLDWYSVYISIEEKGYRYHHYNSMKVDVDIESDQRDDKLHNLAIEIRDFLQKEVKNISCDLEKIGYDEIDYVHSIENIKSMIEANNYMFRENGQIE